MNVIYIYTYIANCFCEIFYFRNYCTHCGKYCSFNSSFFAGVLCVVLNKSYLNIWCVKLCLNIAQSTCLSYIFMLCLKYVFHILSSCRCSSYIWKFVVDGTYCIQPLQFRFLGWYLCFSIIHLAIILKVWMCIHLKRFPFAYF